MTRTVLRLISIGVALVCAAHRPAAAAEEATVKAFVAWQGSGQTLQTAVNEATFIGSISGTVYVETEKGPVAGGQMVCPATVRIDLESGAQSGTGRCVMTAEDGARLFGEFSCAGFHLIGCDGDFTLTGGTGRFAGITGGGRGVLRAGERTLTPVAGAGVVETGRGILFWPALSYKLP
jgi:hypothetical protein